MWFFSSRRLPLFVQIWRSSMTSQLLHLDQVWSLVPPTQVTLRVSFSFNGEISIAHDQILDAKKSQHLLKVSPQAWQKYVLQGSSVCMCMDTCNWNIFAVLCTVFAICAHWTISSQIHYKTWSRLIVAFFLWLIYGLCALETLITPLCFQRVGNLAWCCVAISSELKHFILDGSLGRLSPKVLKGTSSRSLMRTRGFLPPKAT